MKEYKRLGVIGLIFVEYVNCYEIYFLVKVTFLIKDPSYRKNFDKGQDYQFPSFIIYSRCEHMATNNCQEIIANLVFLDHSWTP